MDLTDTSLENTAFVSVHFVMGDGRRIPVLIFDPSSVIRNPLSVFRLPLRWQQSAVHCLVTGQQASKSKFYATKAELSVSCNCCRGNVVSELYATLMQWDDIREFSASTSNFEHVGFVPI